MRGFDLSLGRDKVMLDHRFVESYVTQDYTEFAPDVSLVEAESRLVQAKRHEGYVVDADGAYLGTVKLGDLVAQRQKGGVESAMAVVRLVQPDPLTLTAKSSVWQAMARMGDFVGESIPVLEDLDNSRMLGVVFEASIVKAYLDTLNDIRCEENGGCLT